MSNQNKMSVFKKVFIVLLALDSISLILSTIALIPTLKMLAGYGTIMLIVSGTMSVMAVAVMAFEVLAKAFLIRSTSPTSPRAAGHKGYVAWAVLLLVFNFGAVLINALAAGGEGATVLSQSRTYLQILTSVAEIITIFCYLPAAKKSTQA